jgi:NADPH:quinone reductase-like Zn-dependent oxidoreductase
MKAIVYTRYGSPDVLQLTEAEQPIPKDGEVLVKVHAASINALDWHLMRGSPFLVRTGGNGLGKPKDQRLGVDLAGRVEAAGANVTQFQIGDEVFGRGHGTLAEYACARADKLLMKPSTIPFEAAAATPVAALIALASLREKGRIQAGQQVLINGASGGVGTFAVQIAKALGAEVTAVCSTRNVEMARSLGADHIIDYTQEDFTRKGQRYDLILGINGYRRVSAYRRALRPTGTYVMVGAANDRLLRALFQVILLGSLMPRTRSRRVGVYMSDPSQQDFVFVKGLLETGKVVPMVERTYPLSETAEAFRYFEEIHAKGKLVITV